MIRNDGSECITGIKLFTVYIDGRNERVIVPGRKKCNRKGQQLTEQWYISNS